MIKKYIYSVFLLVIIAISAINTTLFAEIKITSPTTDLKFIQGDSINIRWDSQYPVDVFFNTTVNTDWKLIAEQVYSQSYKYQLPIDYYSGFGLRIEAELPSRLEVVISPWPPNFPTSFLHVEFSPKGERVLFASDKGQILIMDALNKYKEIHRILCSKTSYQGLYATFYKNDDNFIYSDYNPILKKNVIYQYTISTETKTVLYEFDTPVVQVELAHSDSYRYYTFTTHKASDIFIHDTLTSQTKAKSLTNDLIYSEAIYPNEEKIAIGTYNGEVIILDIELNELSRFFAHTASNPIFSIDVSPNGQYLATGSTDDSLKVWSALDYSLIDSYQPETNIGDIRKVKFHPNSELLIFCSFGELFEERDFLNHLTLSTSVLGIQLATCDYSPNGDFVITAGREQLFTLYKRIPAESYSDEKYYGIGDLFTIEYPDTMMITGNSYIIPLKLKVDSLIEARFKDRKINLSLKSVYPTLSLHCNYGKKKTMYLLDTILFNKEIAIKNGYLERFRYRALSNFKISDSIRIHDIKFSEKGIDISLPILKNNGIVSFADGCSPSLSNIDYFSSVKPIIENNILHLEINNNNFSSMQLYLSNILGERNLLYDSKVMKLMTIEYPLPSRGVYFLIIEIDGQIFTEKIVNE